MSEIKEILFALNDIRKGEVGDDYKKSNASIFHKAKPAILNFPVIVSDSISLEDLTMVNKALEREYATVVRLAMGLDDVMDGEHGELSKIDYINKFHTNGYSSDDKSIFSMNLESANLENLAIAEDVHLENFSEKEAIRESLGLNMRNLNEMTSHNDNQYINLSEARHSTKMTRTMKGDTEEISNSNNRSLNLTGQYGISNGGNGGRNGNGRNGGAENLNISLNGGRTHTNGNKTTRYGDTVEVVSDTSYEDKLEYSDYKGQLLDNDVKKANELIPTTLDITVYHKLDKEVITDHILLGVKCVAHKVSSKEMIENIADTLETKGRGRGFFRFIQWTTGEIKFFKDYLLCLDNLKREALKIRKNRADKSARWFRELKNKATISKLRGAFNLKKQLIPNSTLVLSIEEVDYLRNTLNIDLLNDKFTVNKLMDNYFLIGLVIVDSGAEVCRFKFDSFDKYQTFSYRSLERENRNQGNDIKALVSLMSKY